MTGVGVVLACATPRRPRFYTRHSGSLEAARSGSLRTSLFPCAKTQARGDASRDGLGYRYTTIQVFDCDAEHAGILARGGAEGASAITLGKTARFSFVRDPDGNWIEISQRASLTGPLPS